MSWLLARSPLLIPLAVICVGFWPGTMNADTLAQIEQVAGAIPINDHHAPILGWLWSLVWPLGVGPGTVLLLQTSAFLAGAYLIARSAFGPFAASLVAAVVAFWPAVFGNLALVGRDTWFLAFLLLTFGFLVLAARSDGRAMRWALLAALASAFFCLAARQNAAAAIVVALTAGAAIWLAPQLRGRRRLVRLGMPLLVGVGLTVTMVALQLAVVRVAGTDRAYPEQYVYLYDLAAISREEGESAFPESVYPSEDAAPLVALSSLDSIIPLAFDERTPIPMPRSPEDVSDMQEAWFDEVSGDPLQYLDIRWDAWLRQIGLTHAPVWIYHPFVDPNQRGFETEFEGPNDLVRGYQELFANEFNDGGILHRAWIYLLVATAATALLLRRRPALALVGALAITAWTYQIGLFFGTMGTQWRFEYPVAAVSLICAAVAAKVVFDQTRRPPAINARPTFDSASGSSGAAEPQSLIGGRSSA